MRTAEVDAVPSFTFEGRRVFVVFTEKGGPPVLLMHEAPGMTPDTFRLARALASEGFVVYMPLMFGTAGKASSSLGTIGHVVAAELSGKFEPLSAATPPIAASLRRLAAEIHRRHPSQSLGAIGMCLSGAVPVALLGPDRPYIRAAILSQPALPSVVDNIAGTRPNAAKLGVSPADVENAKKSGVPIRGFRFTSDTVSRHPRQQAFTATFGKQIVFEELPIDHPAHSVLTKELFDAQGKMKASGPSRHAYDEVIAYLHQQLPGR